MPASATIFNNEQINAAVQAVEWLEARGIRFTFHDGVLIPKAKRPPDRFTLETLRTWRPIIKYVIKEVADATMTKIDFRSFQEYAEALRRRRIKAHVPPPAEPGSQTMKETETAPAYRRMHAKDRFTAAKLMEANLKRIEGTEFWHYLNNYSDARIADEVRDLAEGRPVKTGNIGNLRSELFGALRMARKTKAEENTSELRDEIEDLRSGLAAVIKAHNGLLDRLSMRVSLGEGWPAWKVHRTFDDADAS